MKPNYQKLIDKLDPARYKLDEPMSKHTTVQIGGPADIWYESPNSEDLIQVIKLARENEIPITMIGGGSNVLVGDKGIRGIVIKNNSREIKIGNELPVEESSSLEEEVEARWQSVTTETGGRTMYEFKDLNYDESDKQRIEVKLESGVAMPFAMNFLIQKGITGLQWYARIPGNLGGWVYNNTHGGTHFMNELISEVEVVDENNERKVLKSTDLETGYDQSRFHKTKEIILGATLNMYLGDKQKAQYVAMEWAKRKAIQPGRSPGCVFQNIKPEEAANLNLPSTSVGYVVEHVLRLSGFKIGQAAISAEHHNFIENLGGATANDYIAVIKEMQKRAAEEINIELKPEIFFLGEF